MVEKLLYARLSSFSGSFKIPTIVSGSQLSLITPSYSTILGIISQACNRYVDPKETRIGFRYHYPFKELDLETVHRWGREKEDGDYKYSGTAPRNREIHYRPVLEIFLDNLNFENNFLKPENVLYLGRSQDIVTIEKVSVISVHKRQRGKLRGTLIPFKTNTDTLNYGILYNLPEFFENNNTGKIRQVKNIQTFIAFDWNLRIIENNQLYIPSDLENLRNNGITFEENEAIYLHKWSFNV